MSEQGKRFDAGELDQKLNETLHDYIPRLRGMSVEGYTLHSRYMRSLTLQHAALRLRDEQKHIGTQETIP